MAGAARVHLIEKGRDPRRYAMVALRRRRAGACRAGRARAGHRPGADPAGLRRGLGARLPRRAARLRAVAQRADRRSARASTGRRPTRMLAAARSVGAQPPARGRRRRLRRSRSSAPPRCASSASSTRSWCACRTARSRREPAGADPSAFAETYPHALHARRRRRRHRGAVVPRPRQRPGAADRALRRRSPATPSARSAQGRIGRPTSRAGSTTRRSTTATRSRPARPSPVRRSSRSARRRRSSPPGDSADGGCRRATCASPSPPRRTREAIVTPGMSLEPRRWRASRPIRSGSRSCGRG